MKRDASHARSPLRPAKAVPVRLSQADKQAALPPPDPRLSQATTLAALTPPPRTLGTQALEGPVPHHRLRGLGRPPGAAPNARERGPLGAPTRGFWNSATRALGEATCGHKAVTALVHAAARFPASLLALTSPHLCPRQLSHRPRHLDLLSARSAGWA